MWCDFEQTCITCFPCLPLSVGQFAMNSLVLIDMFTNDSFGTSREKRVSGVCQIYDKV